MRVGFVKLSCFIISTFSFFCCASDGFKGAAQVVVNRTAAIVMVGVGFVPSRVACRRIALGCDDGDGEAKEEPGSRERAGSIDMELVAKDVGEEEASGLMLPVRPVAPRNTRSRLAMLLMKERGKSDEDTEAFREAEKEAEKMILGGMLPFLETTP
ncbi:hypothetical protein HN446_02240 [bacterium]|jgi:hypothetical protein|nr:hypothetical protein [bacterium]